MKHLVHKVAVLNRFIILSVALAGIGQAVAVNCNGTDYTAIGSGAGTSTDPVIIKDAVGLAALATCTNTIGNITAGFTYELSADIALTGEWSPIGNGTGLQSTPFQGSFNGNNKTISGLTIANGGFYQGLFAHTISATISNINLTNVNINTNFATNNFIGALVGSADSTAISNITVAGTITGSRNIGGIAGATNVGTTNASSVTNSSNSAAINLIGGNNGVYVGGIIGMASSSNSVTNSYNSGAINGGNSYTGGLVGGFMGNSTIIQSYNAGLVTGPSSASAALYGMKMNGSTQTITNSYFDKTVSGVALGFPGDSSTTDALSTLDMSQLASSTTMTGFDFSPTGDWILVNDDVYHYPQLRALYNGTPAQKAYSMSSTLSSLAVPVPVIIPSSGLLALLALSGLLVVGTIYRVKIS